MIRWVSLLAVVVSLFAPHGASAGGIIIPVAGTRALSMGGAWLAQGDDLTVIDHNPAELTRQRDYGIELNYTAYVYGAEYDAAPVDGVGDPPPVRNNAEFVNHIPNVFGNIPFGDRWNLGVAVFSPIGPRHRYPDDGGQRYQLQQAQLNLVWGAAYVAWRPTDQLSVAVGTDIGLSWAKEKIAVGLVPGFRSLDGSIFVDGQGLSAPRGKAGLVWQINDRLCVGVVGAHGIKLGVSGKLTAEVPQAGINPEDSASSDNIHAEQWYPAELRAGFGFRNQDFRAEIAGRYYFWSDYEQLAIDLEHESIAGMTFPDVIIEKSFRNSFTVQGGVGYRFFERHEIRMGYMFDQAAALDENLAINDVDADKHMVGGGYGLELKRVNLAVAYSRIFFPERVVRGGKSKALSVVADSGVSNDGIYRWDVQLIGVNAGVRF